MNINEIAKLAGVSRATVSRYLNNGYVSEEKRAKIKEIIEKTNYKPSGFAQTLRNKKTNYIGVIIPKINSDSISRMISGISQILNASGYQLLLACTHNNEKEELNYLDLFTKNNVDGLILLGTIFTKEHISTLKNMTIPIVILGQNLQGYSCVYFDDYNAAYNITNDICKTAKNIGYLGVTQKDKAVGLNRYKGFLKALEDNNIDFSQKNYEECGFDIDSAYKGTKNLFNNSKKIDTLICATDTLALGAMKCIKENNLKIPYDIQLSGIGDSTMSQLTEPPLTTVHFYYDEAGKEAASLLLNLIKEGTAPINKEIKLNFSIKKNKSTRN